MLINANGTHGIVNRVQNALFTYQGWPSVARDEKGTLYAVASSLRVEHVCPFGKTAMYISRDEGKTWTPPIVINDTYLDDRDAGIVYMGNGRMLVTWFTHPTKYYLNQYYHGIVNSTQKTETAPVLGMLSMYQFIPEELSHGGSFIRISEDYGVTWSETIQVPISAPHGPSLCKDGTLVYLGKELWSSTMENPEIESVIALYASNDGGYTWQRRGLCDKPKSDELSWDNFHEPHVIELPDGRLFGTIRADGKEVYRGFTVYSTISEDGGITWSEWKHLKVSGSPPHLLLHSSGALVCVIGRREPPFGQRAIVSYDLGETWEDEYILNDLGIDTDLGYPASVELDDGSIMTVYYQKYTDENGKTDPKCSILYTKWRLKE
ncbi:MAG: exo-alpha-sialidase [Clostridiales bacterium]|nr:exo-alpha-sialidase [Clostridiales bacterium]